MSKIKQRLVYLLTNGGFGALVYYGLFADVTWAANIVRFLVPLHLFLSVLVAGAATCMLTQLETDEDARNTFATYKGLAFPAVVDITYDVAVVFALAAAGWEFWAFMWMAQILPCHLCHEAMKDGNERSVAFVGDQEKQRLSQGDA